MPRILILCKANICRSPMAEALLRACFPRDGQLIASAGLAALRGSPIDPRAEKTLVRHGLSASGQERLNLLTTPTPEIEERLGVDAEQAAALVAFANEPNARLDTLLIRYMEQQAQAEEKGSSRLQPPQQPARRAGGGCPRSG